tara:strand:+ start:215 stop:610 length:396 start_codon:yes stop_codon:yes gene_type:complete
MKQILKYLLLILIGIIIFVLVNNLDSFSIGIPFSIDDEVKYIGSTSYFIMDNGEIIHNAPSNLVQGRYITPETRGRVLRQGRQSLYGRTYIVRFYTGVGGDLTILENQLELYPNITPIPLPNICAARSAMP